MILEKLGIYGWSEEDENLVLASVLTGDPLLLIGTHGCAKTQLAERVAAAISMRFIAYDASKALFDDVLGYPDIEKLKQGRIEYISSGVAVWGKEFVLVDELNRAVPELQSKWLELIRSRTMMGFPTEVRWVWAAMNPVSYFGTQALDEALIGRFSLFVYPPEALKMNEKDRIKVAEAANGEDAPAVAYWLNGHAGKTGKTGKEDNGNGQPGLGKQDSLVELLKQAAAYYTGLRKQIPALAEFLSRFSELVWKDTSGKINLDGRRLGFIYRNLLSVRAVELAKQNTLGAELKEFAASARYTLLSSIPVGLNDADNGKKQELIHKIELCFELFSDYFKEGSSLRNTELIYELFCSAQPVRKAEILLTEKLPELCLTKAWNDLKNSKTDITVFAYVAMQVEAKKPGTLPQELIEALAGSIDGKHLSTECIPTLKNHSVEHIEEIEALLRAQRTDLGRIVAIDRIARLSKKENITGKDVRQVRKDIAQDIVVFQRLIGNS